MADKEKEKIELIDGSYDTLTEKYILPDCYLQQSIAECELVETMPHIVGPFDTYYGNRTAVRRKVEELSRFEKSELKMDSVDIEFRMDPEKHLSAVFFSVPGCRNVGDALYFIICRRDYGWKSFICIREKKGYSLYMESTGEIEPDGSFYLLYGSDTDEAFLKACLGQSYGRKLIRWNEVEYLVCYSPDKKSLMIFRSIDGEPSFISESDMENKKEIVECFLSDSVYPFC